MSSQTVLSQLWPLGNDKKKCEAYLAYVLKTKREIFECQIFQ